jgi:hypothetical protein
MLPSVVNSHASSGSIEAFTSLPKTRRTWRDTWSLITIAVRRRPATLKTAKMWPALASTFRSQPDLRPPQSADAASSFLAAMLPASTKPNRFRVGGLARAFLGARLFAAFSRIGAVTAALSWRLASSRSFVCRSFNVILHGQVTFPRAGGSRAKAAWESANATDRPESPI